jgi:hypothetical protein
MLEICTPENYNSICFILVPDRCVVDNKVSLGELFPQTGWTTASCRGRVSQKMTAPAA